MKNKWYIITVGEDYVGLDIRGNNGVGLGFAYQPKLYDTRKQADMLVKRYNSVPHTDNRKAKVRRLVMQ